MENGFKLRVSKLFQSSFNSCRTKHTSDVADQPFFFPENHHHRQLIDLFSPKPHPFPVSRKSKPHISTGTGNPLFPAVKVAGKTDSVSISPPENRKNSKTAKKKKPHHRKPIKIQDFSSITDNYYYDFCSSDEDDQNDDESHETTLFSSRSFSSDSSASFRKNRATRRKNKNKSYKTTVRGGGGGGGGGCKDRKSTDVIPIKGVGKLVKDSVAIVKKSSDPHEDFRVSMLEMIVERQILGAKDLEELLLCFLSLNSEEHHGVICEVFAEIWETLFSDWF
ncbi:hypothetical protein SSX86_009852 [Deinandra increscens subsp. villosa]|uniref:Transcription repressor n=1 Tax=Deinandra increscens subsp. villosa TaxID=3103831 RepID=A0AAP0DAE6_9ASTR